MKIALILLALFLVVAAGCTKTNVAEKKLYPSNGFDHGHGLAASEDGIYIATHHGLFVLINETSLFSVGKSQDDFMGFSLHPQDSNIVYSSGHPARGGNLGVQKSEDGGFTWKKISDGIGGPVDFHAMAISPANPQLLYGWYRGIFQKSTDSGKSWDYVAETDFPIVSIAPDSKDESKVYAASPKGLYVSNDQGKTWSSKQFTDFVSAVAVNPNDSKNILVFNSDKLMRTDDAGQTWKEVKADFKGGTILYIAFENDSIYALTEMNQIFRTSDGKSWDKIY